MLEKLERWYWWVTDGLLVVIALYLAGCGWRRCGWATGLAMLVGVAVVWAVGRLVVWLVKRYVIYPAA